MNMPTTNKKQIRWEFSKIEDYMRDAIHLGVRKATMEHVKSDNTGNFYLKRQEWLEQLSKQQFITKVQYDIAKALFVRPKAQQKQQLDKLEAKIVAEPTTTKPPAQVVESMENITINKTVSLSDVLDMMRNSTQALTEQIKAQNRLIETLSRPRREPEGA